MGEPTHVVSSGLDGARLDDLPLVPIRAGTRIGIVQLGTNDFRGVRSLADPRPVAVGEFENVCRKALAGLRRTLPVATLVVVGPWARSSATSQLGRR